MTSTIWSFHNQIAIPLEMNARGLLKLSANNIEGGIFVEVMLYLLRSKYGFDCDLSSFIKECAPYLGKSGIEIEKERAISLYEMFLEKYEMGD